jgi:hypothetical protein
VQNFIDISPTFVFTFTHLKRNFMKALLYKITLAAVFCSTALLAACGGGGSAAPTLTTSTVASGNLSTPITAANATALSNVTQTFVTGVPEFGTTGTTTLAFTTTGTGTTTATGFVIASGGGTASGAMRFGSCIFDVSFSTIAGLVAPRTITIPTCSVNIPTNGAVVGSTTSLPLTFTLGALTGTGSTVTIIMAANGDVTIGGIAVGRVTVTSITGASS